MVNEKKNLLHIFVRWLNRKNCLSGSRFVSTIQALGLVAQWEVSLIADPEVVSSIPARSHTFVEIDCEIYSAVIFSFLWIKMGWCKLKAKVCA